MVSHHRLRQCLNHSGVLAILLWGGTAWAQDSKAPLSQSCHDAALYTDLLDPSFLETSPCKAIQTAEVSPETPNEPASASATDPALLSAAPSNRNDEPSSAIALTADGDNAIDVDPELIESSPVLQRWLEEIPDVATDIKHDPAFRTRLRLGYAYFPSNDQTSGFQVGVQDLFIGRTPLTLSADYSQNGRGDRASYGLDAQYYVLPLGSYGNFAPVLGYRHLETPNYSREGVNVGFRVVLIPSRTGAADVSLTQSWVAPSTDEEVGLTTFSVGYAITSQLRISTDIQTQNTEVGQDSRVGVLLEWML